MKMRNKRSIIIISLYFLLNALVIVSSWFTGGENNQVNRQKMKRSPQFTEIENLNYFHLKEGVPQMSLNAVKMRSLDQRRAEFDLPQGVYNFRKKNKSIKYSADTGLYVKAKEVLNLKGNVDLQSAEANYYADMVNYYFTKDLVIGTGNVKFEGEDLKSKDYVVVESQTMHANPEAKMSKFKGDVRGSLRRKKQYEGKMTFASQELQMDGNSSLAQLQGDVRMKRDTYNITAGKADIYLDNYNKSLKYFVLNDDVKVTSRQTTPEGVQERKAFSERLEGFGREQRMVLSGAPRVEMGKDIIKGYRITIRENVDLVEVDDAMSDVQVKRAPKKLKE